MLDLFLIVLALVWLIFASISDIRKLEVPDWLSFSLIIFAVAYRAVYSIIISDWMFLVYGLFGLGVFIILGYLFYYSRLFAGGDAKLLFGIGAILAVSSTIWNNLIIFGVFIFLVLLAGSVYGLVWSIVVSIINRESFSKEWKKQYKDYRILLIGCITVAVILFVALLFLQQPVLLFIPLFVIAYPLLFIYAKSVEESGMIRLVSASQLTEGDWLYSAVKIKGKIIQPNWEGLSTKELKLFKNYKGKIKVKYGIPFVPAFLLAFVALLFYLRYSGFTL
jgi:Flp pilus assembly protein protease CpaA